MNYLSIFNEHISEIGFHMEKEMLVINICKRVSRMIKCEENHVMKIPKGTRFVIVICKSVIFILCCSRERTGING